MLPYFTDLFSNVTCSYTEILEANAPTLSYPFTKLCGAVAQKIFIAMYSVFLNISGILDHITPVSHTVVFKILISTNKKHAITQKP
jgi:hypothetical protein